MKNCWPLLSNKTILSLSWAWLCSPQFVLHTFLVKLSPFQLNFCHDYSMNAFWVYYGLFFSTLFLIQVIYKDLKAKNIKTYRGKCLLLSNDEFIRNLKLLQNFRFFNRSTLGLNWDFSQLKQTSLVWKYWPDYFWKETRLESNSCIKVGA